MLVSSVQGPVSLKNVHRVARCGEVYSKRLGFDDISLAELTKDVVELSGTVWVFLTTVAK